MTLNEILKIKVKDWRENDYKSNYPVIREIFEYNFLDTENQNLRYLRKAQFEALETYWYLRIVENTPHIFDLYKKYFRAENLLNALNINLTEEDLKKIAFSNGGGINTVFKKIKKFRDERDWMQFHDPKSMAASITIEAAELLEHFQWRSKELIEE
jgi:hypothetical protein